MLYRGFCYGSNATQSIVADCERLINWYPEIIQAPGAPTTIALFPTPGSATFLTAEDVGARALFAVGTQCFAVIGGGFYELFSNGSYTRIGNVTQDSNPATISYNGVAGGQLFITSGNQGYCYVLATGVLSQVLTDKATMGGMVDSRFIAFDKATGTVWMSDANDGTTWDATLFFQRSAAPDPWQAMVTWNREIWLIGTQTGEVWYNSGAFPQPFALIPGSVFTGGTVASFCVGVAGDALVWLSQTPEGAGQMVMARGYSPDRISNYAVETALSRAARTATLMDAEVFTYQAEGHMFAGWTLPTARQGWFVDLATGMWHERLTWVPAQSRYETWHPRVHCYAFGKHLIGERATAKISTLDVTEGLEADGSAIRRVRVGPPLWALPGQRVQVGRLELLCDTGVGTTSGQGVDPQMMLRTSPNGHTWSNERLASLGAMGQYSKRVYWTRCGSSDKLWVPEVSVTDPVPVRLSGADLTGTGFAQVAQAA